MGGELNFPGGLDFPEHFFGFGFRWGSSGRGRPGDEAEAACDFKFCLKKLTPVHPVFLDGEFPLLFQRIHRLGHRSGFHIKGFRGGFHDLLERDIDMPLVDAFIHRIKQSGADAVRRVPGDS